MKFGQKVELAEVLEINCGNYSTFLNGLVWIAAAAVHEIRIEFGGEFHFISGALFYFLRTSSELVLFANKQVFGRLSQG